MNLDIIQYLFIGLCILWGVTLALLLCACGSRNDYKTYCECLEISVKRAEERNNEIFAKYRAVQNELAVVKDELAVFKAESTSRNAANTTNKGRKIGK